MASMEVVCIDGTVIECDNIKPQNKGIKLQQKVNQQQQTIGFVPWWTLMYVIPENVVHNLDEIENPEQLGAGSMGGGSIDGGAMGGGSMGNEETEQ